MTAAQITLIVDDAKAVSRRAVGREDPEFIYAYLAAQNVGAMAHISAGYIRAGGPTERAAKAEPPVVA